jgi:hypothetical protein
MSKVFSVRELGESFPTPFQAGAVSRLSWAEAKRMGQAQGICGEIRTEDDLKYPKKDTVLRAVYIPDDDGGAVRWADTKRMTRVLSGIDHEHLACAGDEIAPTLQGYIIVGSDGSVRVTNKNGK